MNLKRLFKALDTPHSERDPYDTSIKDFPYVNGGLFKEDTEIPNFSEAAKDFLLHKVSAPVNWSQISPTIFGGIFESTLNPETRRKGGMHYTSPENIHKVIDPLFLDDLKKEFTDIRDNIELTPRQKKNRYKLFLDKLCSLKFFDPAAGSGNFLTETYLCLRKLEDSVLIELRGGQAAFGFEEDEDKGKRVSLNQFYGIEINDFAVTVAETALWISRLKANGEESMLLSSGNDFPLSERANIVHANALRIDWNEVIPASECSYIMGNPPFLGHISRSDEQSNELRDIWGTDAIGRLDYVTGWYKVAVDYAAVNSAIEWAFVSTNSICMGEPVPALFRYIFDNEWRIKFAHRTFIWDNEAADKAHVHVVIVGFSKNVKNPVLYSYKNGTSNPSISIANSINGYLLDAPNVFVEQQRTILSPLLNPVTMGNMARGTGLIIEEEDVEPFLADPIASKYVHRFIMGRELIHNIKRYCLWMEGCNTTDIEESQLLKERIESVKEFRLSSSAASTREMATTPYLFGQRAFVPTGTYLGIPKVFSGTRTYASCDLLSQDIIPGDKVYVCDDPDGFQFAMISSFWFISWQKAIGGRLKSDCSFSNTVVWNTFPVPAFDSDSYSKIVDAGRVIIEVRRKYPEKSLADLYNPEKMPSDLLSAHKELDKAVEEAYGVDFDGDEEKIVTHLFKIYDEMTRSV